MKNTSFWKAALALILVLTCMSAYAGPTKEEAAAPDTGNFNETGLPIVNEPVTVSFANINFWNTSDFTVLALVKQLEEMTNVKIEWRPIDGGELVTQVNLILASGELPDAFSGINLPKPAELGAQGIVIPQDDLISKYAPNIQARFAEAPMIPKTARALDGNLYNLPWVWQTYTPISEFMLIRKSWMERTNQEIPTTTDEFYDMLVAFKEGDPNANGKADEIPLGAIWKDEISGGHNMFGPWDTSSVYGGVTLVRDDRTIIAPALEPGYVDAVKYFHRLYSEGLLDKETFTYPKAAPAFHSKVANGTVGVYTARNGISSQYPLDLLGISRLGALGPDMGAYERVENDSISK